MIFFCKNGNKENLFYAKALPMFMSLYRRRRKGVYHDWHFRAEPMDNKVSILINHCCIYTVFH